MIISLIGIIIKSFGILCAAHVYLLLSIQCFYLLFFLHWLIVVQTAYRVSIKAMAMQIHTIITTQWNNKRVNMLTVIILFPILDVSKSEQCTTVC